MPASPPASELSLLSGLVAASVVFALLALLVWSGVFVVRMLRLRHARLEAAAEEELTGIVLDQLSGYGAAALKLNLLSDWKREILLRILQNLIDQTKGRDQANLIRILHDAGFQQTALEHLRNGARPALRQGACGVLGYFEDAASIAALQVALDDTDPAVRLTAARALLRKDRIDSIVILLRQLRFAPEDPPLVLGEIFALLPARLLAEAVRLLGTRDLPPEWLRMLVLALARRQVFEAFDAIASLCHAPEPRVRSAAWVALTELGDPRAGEIVLEGLRDPVADVRQVAGQCAGKLGGPEVLPELQRLAAEGGWWNRYHAATALASFGPDGRQALAAMVATAPPDDPLRQAWNDTSTEGAADGR